MKYRQTNKHEIAVRTAVKRFGKVTLAGLIAVGIPVLLQILGYMQTDPSFAQYGAEITLLIAVILAVQKYLKEKKVIE